MRQSNDRQRKLQCREHKRRPCSVLPKNGAAKPRRRNAGRRKRNKLLQKQRKRKGRGRGVL